MSRVGLGIWCPRAALWRALWVIEVMILKVAETWSFFVCEFFLYVVVVVVSL